MKKIITFAASAVMVLSVCALTACGGGSSSGGDAAATTSADAGSATSKYVGTWKAADVTFGDESEALGGDFIMTINEDGTGELSGEGETAKFTWTEIGDGIKAKGDVNATFKDDGDNITTSIFGASLTFEKQ